MCMIDEVVVIVIIKECIMCKYMIFSESGSTIKN